MVELLKLKRITVQTLVETHLETEMKCVIAKEVHAAKSDPRKV